MMNSGEQFDWHYIGRFGPLGPLSIEQMEELVQDEVIQTDSYVWRAGMPEWDRAFNVPEIRGFFKTSAAPPPSPPPSPIHIPQSRPSSTYAEPPPIPSSPNFAFSNPQGMPAQMAMVPVSTRSRVAGGILNILLPGVGRMYLGYVGTGIWQLLTSFCFGLGYVWSLIDGILILTGNLKIDGNGQVLKD